MFTKFIDLEILSNLSDFFTKHIWTTVSGFDCGFAFVHKLLLSRRIIGKNIEYILPINMKEMKLIFNNK